MNTRYLLRLTGVVVVTAGSWVMPAMVSAQGFNPMGWMDPTRWMDRHGYGDDYGYGVPGYGPGASAYGPAYGPAYPPAGYGYGSPYGGGMAPRYAPGYAPAQGLPYHGQGRQDYGWEPAPGVQDTERRYRADDGARSRPSAGDAFRDSGMRDPWLDSGPRGDDATGPARTTPWDGGEGSAWPPKAPSGGGGGGEGGGHYDRWPGGHSGRAAGWGVPDGNDRPVRREGFLESAPGAALPPAAIDWPDRSGGAERGGRDEGWGTAPPSRQLPHGGRWPSGGR